VKKGPLWKKRTPERGTQPHWDARNQAPIARVLKGRIRERATSAEGTHPWVAMTAGHKGKHGNFTKGTERNPGVMNSSVRKKERRREIPRSVSDEGRKRSLSADRQKIGSASEHYHLLGLGSCN